MSERARVCDSCKVFAIHELRSDDATKEVTTGKSNALSSNGTQMCALTVNGCNWNFEWKLSKFSVYLKMKWAQLWSHSTVRVHVWLTPEKTERNLFIFYCLSPLVEIHWKNQFEWVNERVFKTRIAHHFHRVRIMRSVVLQQSYAKFISFRFEKKF